MGEINKTDKLDARGVNPAAARGHAAHGLDSARGSPGPTRPASDSDGAGRQRTPLSVDVKSGCRATSNGSVSTTGNKVSPATSGSASSPMLFMWTPRRPAPDTQIAPQAINHPLDRCNRTATDSPAVRRIMASLATRRKVTVFGPWDRRCAGVEAVRRRAPPGPPTLDDPGTVGPRPSPWGASRPWSSSEQAQILRFPFHADSTAC
jgi:hypothetical protein